MGVIAPIAPRLGKLLLMLSSEQPGEVVNAARAIAVRCKTPAQRSCRQPPATTRELAPEIWTER